MIALGNLLIALAQLLGSIIWLYIYVLMARVILSYVNPDPRNVIVQYIYGATEPVLDRIRRKVPPLGIVDTSPILVFLLLYFINSFLVQTLLDYGQTIRISAATGM